jgi:hypothetical protein
LHVVPSRNQIDGGQKTNTRILDSKIASAWVSLQNLLSKLAGPKDLPRGSATGVRELTPAPGPRTVLFAARVITFAVRLLKEFSRWVSSVSRLELLLSGLAAVGGLAFSHWRREPL